jgi:hypothetical protein
MTAPRPGARANGIAVTPAIPPKDSLFPVTEEDDITAFLGHVWQAAPMRWWAYPVDERSITGWYTDMARAERALRSMPRLAPLLAPEGLTPWPQPAPAGAWCWRHRGPMGDGRSWTDDHENDSWVCDNCAQHLLACQDPNCGCKIG